MLIFCLPSKAINIKSISQLKSLKCWYYTSSNINDFNIDKKGNQCRPCHSRYLLTVISRQVFNIIFSVSLTLPGTVYRHSIWFWILKLRQVGLTIGSQLTVGINKIGWMLSIRQRIWVQLRPKPFYFSGSLTISYCNRKLLIPQLAITSPLCMYSKQTMLFWLCHVSMFMSIFPWC